MGTPGSNPVQGCFYIFTFFFSFSYHKSWDRRIKMEDNPSFEEEIVLLLFAPYCQTAERGPRLARGL